MAKGKKKRWAGRVLLGFVLLALVGMSISALMFSSWSEVHSKSAEQADRAFAESIQSAGGGPAYVVISEDGKVKVRRELERPVRAQLSALHLLAWDPDGEKLLEVEFPYWFVRLKMTNSLNLGTLTSALAGDWEHLDIKVSEQELERRGPGIVLNHTLADGSRILLWTTGKSS